MPTTQVAAGDTLVAKYRVRDTASNPAPVNMAEQVGDGHTAVGGGFCGGMRAKFTPSIDFYVTGIAWASSTESGGPTRACRVLDASSNELARSADSTVSFQGPNDYTPGPVLNLQAPYLVHAGTDYWAEAYVVGYNGTKFLNRRQTNILASVGAATFTVTQRVNGSVDPAQGFSWNSPNGTIFTNQDNSSGTAYEHCILYGYA